MLISLLFLILGLVLILIAAKFFTNGIEEFGRHFSFSQAAVGSILPQSAQLCLKQSCRLLRFSCMAVLLQRRSGWVQFSAPLSCTRVGMDPLIFGLLLAPVATELPEKFNSVTWTWKGRDTLALGNITGAMVFQVTFPVSVGRI
jgi:Ca2+/Na+ antiporter